MQDLRDRFSFVAGRPRVRSYGKSRPRASRVKTLETDHRLGVHPGAATGTRACPLGDRIRIGCARSESMRTTMTGARARALVGRIRIRPAAASGGGAGFRLRSEFLYPTRRMTMRNRPRA